MKTEEFGTGEILTGSLFRFARSVLRDITLSVSSKFICRSCRLFRSVIEFKILSDS